MKVLTVVGARPQFIKAWPVSEALVRQGLSEYLVHTGQHYDDKMSEVFFRELGIRPPAANLEVGSGPHGHQTGLMLQKLEPIVLEQRPDVVLVYGDTNSTLAAALVAVKLQIPIVHVEAGLRSFNRAMPEEHNRVLTDHCSALLLCPTETAVRNLAREGIHEGVHLVGDVMQDALLGAYARAGSPGLSSGAAPGTYFLATIHRAENTDTAERLAEIFRGLEELPLPVVLPVHPRLRACLQRFGIRPHERIRLIEPLGYLDMVRATSGARAVFTDSGGLQKEAVWLGVPCVTLREETEWVETLADGWNQLAGASARRMHEAAARLPAPRPPTPPSASAAEQCAKLVRNLDRHSS
jgi:UDP-GlcNAc3NAcA epimerase